MLLQFKHKVKQFWLATNNLKTQLTEYFLKLIHKMPNFLIQASYEVTLYLRPYQRGAKNYVAINPLDTISNRKIYLLFTYLIGV